MSKDVFDKFFESKETQSYLSPVSEVATAVNSTNSPMTVEEITAEFYRRLEEHNVNLSDIKPMLEDEGNQLVISGAGSGKTTALVFKLIKGSLTGEYMKTVTVETSEGTKLVTVPKKILVSTFLKSGAEDLKNSFLSWCKKLNIVGISESSIKFCTLHSEFYAVLKQIGVPMTILSEETTTKCLRDALATFNIQSTEGYGKERLNLDEINDLAGIITYARNRLDSKRYENMLMDKYTIDSTTLPLVIEKYQTLRRVVYNGLDFEDLQELLYEYAEKNPALAQVLSSRYDIIMLDEFQDTSQIQYALLKHYINGAEKVIAIGDDDQTIYSWRGSDIDIITSKFEQDYKPSIPTLTTNYRCKGNILAPVINSISLNQKRHKKDIKWANEGGTVNVIYKNTTALLLKSIMEDLDNGMTVGVLSRTNFDLVIPAVLLELYEGRKINYNLAKGVSLQTRVPSLVLGCMELVLKRETSSFATYLNLFLPGYKRQESKILTDILKANREHSLFTLPERDLAFSVPDLYSSILKGLRTANAELGQTGAYLYLLGMLRQTAFKARTVFAEKARNFIRFIEELVLNNKEYANLNVFYDLFMTVLPERLNDRLRAKSKYARENTVGNANLYLSTVHEAKGKEWDSVYIWNDVEGVFPVTTGSRDLTEEEIEEERRIHYIAWTRAKEKLTVFSNTLDESRFLRECGDFANTGRSVKVIETEVNLLNTVRQEQEVRSLFSTLVEGEKTNDVNIQELSTALSGVFGLGYSANDVLKLCLESLSSTIKDFVEKNNGVSISKTSVLRDILYGVFHMTLNTMLQEKPTI